MFDTIQFEFCWLPSPTKCDDLPCLGKSLSSHSEPFCVDSSCNKSYGASSLPDKCSGSSWFFFPNLYENQNSEQKFKNEDPISDLSFFRLNWSENLEPEFQGDLLASAHWFRLVGLPNGRGLKWWEASGMCMHHSQHVGCVFMAYKYPLIHTRLTRLVYLVQVGLKVPGFLHHHVPMYQQQEVAALCLKDGHILALPLQQPERRALSVCGIILT